jgi:glutathione S-transferase
MQRQPFGQMPYLEDTETGVEVFESRAIVSCEYRAIRSTERKLILA